MTSPDPCRKDNAGDGPADVAQHLMGCDPCTTSLEGLKTRGDALGYLATEREGAERVVVDRVLSVTARAGRQKLADLLYELAKACLIADPEAELRTYRGTEPRAVEAVADEMSVVGRRMTPDVPLGELPRVRPSEDVAIDLCKSCICILENVEGPTPRHQLITAQVCIVQEDFQRAVDMCEALLARRLQIGDRGFAYMCLSRALISAGRFEEAAKVGDQAVTELPRSFTLAYNLAVSLAWLRRRDEFSSVASRASRLVGSEAKAWEHSLIRADAPTLARSLECDPVEVLACFGLR